MTDVLGSVVVKYAATFCEWKYESIKLFILVTSLGKNMLKKKKPNRFLYSP